MSIRDPRADFEPRRHTLSPMQWAQSVPKGRKVVGQEAGGPRPMRARAKGGRAGPGGPEPRQAQVQAGQTRTEAGPRKVAVER